jgi:hypothetical protein
MAGSISRPVIGHRNTLWCIAVSQSTWHGPRSHREQTPAAAIAGMPQSGQVAGEKGSSFFLSILRRNIRRCTSTARQQGVATTYVHLFGQKMAGLPHSHSAFDVQRLSFENVSVDSAARRAHSAKVDTGFASECPLNLRAGALFGAADRSPLGLTARRAHSAKVDTAFASECALNLRAGALSGRPTGLHSARQRAGRIQQKRIPVLRPNAP